MRHMRRKHNNVMKQDCESSRNEIIKYGKNHPRQKLITKKILKFIVNNQLAHATIESHDFVDLVNSLDQEYQVNSIF